MPAPALPFDFSRLSYLYRALTLVLPLALTACGGGSGGDIGAAPAAGGTGTTPVAPVTAADATLAASSESDLLDFFKAKLKANATTPSAVATTGAVSTTSPAVSLAAPAAAPAPAAAAPTSAVTVDATPAFAGTVLQEAGVDEDDLVKTDGSTLYALTKNYYSNGAWVPAQLQAQSRKADGSLVAAGRLSLAAEFNYSGFYLAASLKRLAVLSQTRYVSVQPLVTPVAVPAATPGGTTASATASTTASTTAIAPAPANTEKFALDLVSLATPGALILSNRVRIDGTLVGSRMIGNTLYVVSNWSPNLTRFTPTTALAPAETEARLAGLRASDILPTVQVDDQPATPLVVATDCYVQPANASIQLRLTVITAFDLASGSLARASRCFIGGSEALYVSPTNVYLSSSRYYAYAVNAAATVMPTGSRTDIHKFALNGNKINYRGSGDVPGSLGWDSEKVPFRMSEYQGDLRVLSYTGANGWSVASNGVGTTGVPTPPASPATITVLRESPVTATATATAVPTKLVAVGSLPNPQRPAALGKPGEQIYGVQFVGSRAYLVTFRQTDPLYVVDLSRPADPQISGELAMPGYSDYLFPLGDQLLLGVGKDANAAGQVQGVKVALMDVSDPAKPSLVNSVLLGKRGSTSALDSSRHGLSLFQVGNIYRLGLPVRFNEATNAAGTTFAPASQGLARFEVNTSAKTLVSKPTVTSITYTSSTANTLPYTSYDVGAERASQINDSVYYFTGGQFLTSPW